MGLRIVGFKWVGFREPNLLSWFQLQGSSPGVAIGTSSCGQDSTIHQIKSALAYIAEL
jgi:hypothetical protein